MARQIALALFIGAVCVATCSAGVLSGLAGPALVSSPVLSAGLPLVQGPQNPTHIVNPLSVGLPASPLVVPSPAQTLVAHQPTYLAAHQPALLAAPQPAYIAAHQPAYLAASPALIAHQPALYAQQPALLHAAPAGIHGLGLLRK